MFRTPLFPTLVGLAGLVLAAAAQNASPGHPGEYPASDIAAGAVLYGRLCVNCHGVSGTGVGGIDLHHGILPRAQTDDALRAVISTGFPQAGMPSFQLASDELRALVAFVRAGAETGAEESPVSLGDAGRGRAVFETKGKCLTCHRVADRGSFAAPALTSIGRERTPAMIQRSLLEPSLFMRPINRPVRAVMNDGRVITGRRLNEDTYSVQIVSDDGRLLSLVKSEIEQWTVSTTSPMPSYRDALTPPELADLIAYLVSLKG